MDRSKITYVTDLMPTKLNMVAEGYAYVRVPRRGADGDVAIQVLAIPITTKRMVDVFLYIESIRPRPPCIDKYIAVDSEAGKALGITKPEFHTVYDYTDPTYQKKQQDFNIKVTYISAAAAIDLPLYLPTPNGEKEAQGFEDRGEALRLLGLDAASLSSLVAETQKLSVFTMEERRSFFSGGSAAA